MHTSHTGLFRCLGRPGTTRLCRPLLFRYFPEKLQRDLEFRGGADLKTASVTSEQSDGIAVAAETDIGTAHIISGDPVEIFAGQFFRRIGDQAGGFGGETDQKLSRPFPFSERRQNILGPFKFDRSDPSDFFIFPSITRFGR